MIEGHKSCPAVLQGVFCWGFLGHAALLGGAAAVQIDCQIRGRQSLFVCWVQSVAVCGDCFEVAGPSNSTVALYDYGANSTSTFQLVLDWDPSYLGPITLDLVPPAR